MTGSDFLWFLESIWFDLTHLDTADLPSLVFRIIVLVGVVFLGTFLLRVILTVLKRFADDYVFPPLLFLWDALTYPLRLPFRIVRKVRRRIVGHRNFARARQREEALREQAEAERLAAERRERERIAELQKVLKVD